MAAASLVEFVVLLFLTYPLSFLYVEKSPKWDTRIRQLYLGMSGFIFGFLAYGFDGTVHFVLAFLYSYATLYAYAHGHFDKRFGHWVHKFMPFILSTVIMSHLSFCHLHRLFFNAGNAIDLSGPMMVITIKITSLVWNVFDGLQSSTENSTVLHDKHDKHDKHGKHSHHNHHYVEKRKQLCVTEETFPSILEYFGYFFFFPTFLTGPSIEFRQFREQCVDITMYGDGKSAISCKQTWKPAIKKLGMAIGLAVVHLLCVQVPFDSQEPSLVKRLIALFIVTFGLKTKFYFIWTLAEGACIAMGLPDGLMSNVDFVSIEFSPTFQNISRKWNKQTHVWLKQYVFLRLKDAHIPYRVLLTYIISAFWHGFYPGYYLMFGTGALCNLAEDVLEAHVIPNLTAISPSISRVYQITTTALLLNYLCLPFNLLEFGKCLEAWNSLYFFGHAYIIAVLCYGGIMDRKHHHHHEHHHKRNKHHDHHKKQDSKDGKKDS